jgi:hypothetical protein
MFFLNLALSQFLMLAGAASALTVALYLLDRSRRRQVVSTLRFWTQAKQPQQTSRRRHVQQPLSLLLQLLGVLLLLLALTQPRFGNPFAKPGYDVLVLETSAWMAARTGDTTLMDIARRRALQWLASVPASDRVMLVWADGLATPATAFEADHKRVRDAIAASQAGATSLDIGQALGFARRAQSLQGAHGEVVFVGTGRIRDRKEAIAVDTRGLRVIPVADAIENVGLRRVSMKRSAADQTQWDILAIVRNYGAKAHLVTLVAGFDRAPIGMTRMTLAPGAEQEAAFTWRSRRAGLLEMQISPGDAFPDDDRASLPAPALPRLPVVVYTARPDVVGPLLAANSRVDAQFRSPAQYRADDDALVVLDRFRPAIRPKGDTIWIDPPAGESPVPVVKTVSKPQDLRWIANHPLGAGLRAHDAKLQTASVLRAMDGDIRVAEIEDGPVILARPGVRKMVVIGFDPAGAQTRYQLSTPLVFANILRWIDPETFRETDFSVQSAGAVSAVLEGDAGAGQLQVTREDGRPVPFTYDQHTLRFFSGARENVRVAGQDRESMYALTLPEMWDMKWEPPANVARGLPRVRHFEAVQRELWPWLAVLGAGCLAAEWILYARVRRPRRVKPMPVRSHLRRAS